MSKREYELWLDRQPKRLGLRELYDNQTQFVQKLLCDAYDEGYLDGRDHIKNSEYDD